MSLSRFHTGTGNFFDFDPLDGIPWVRGRHPLAPSEETHALKPRTDVHENTDKNLVTATVELPGLSKDNVEIKLRSGVLSISADATQSSEQREQGFTLKERRFGRFVRSFDLADGTKPGDVKASMENGVLTVTFPRSTPSQESQRIPIK